MNSKLALRTRQCDCVLSINSNEYLYLEYTCGNYCRNTPPSRQKEIIEELIATEL